MSRSWRKHGWIKDPTLCKLGKKLANRRVRRTATIPSGKAYRKVFNPYDVHDYIARARPKGSCPDAYKDWMK